MLEWLTNKPDTQKEQNIVLGIHGLGGRAAWCARLAHRLEKHDIYFCALDLIGFGKNHIDFYEQEKLNIEPKPKGKKGHVDSFNDWLSDIESAYGHLKEAYPNARIVVFGHSLGAVIASCLDIEQEDRLILSVPGFKGHPDTFRPGFVIQTLLTLIFNKHAYVELPGSPKGLDGKPAEDPTDKDPLKVRLVTANLLWEILQMGKAAEKNLVNIHCPVLVIEAENEYVICNKTLRQFFNKIASKDKQVKLFSNTLHDWIWHDSVDPISDELARWISS